eukprot:TRINITY_DN49694_c0_g1_i1.p1 TRINITY_DN49694_c0_g1~~TRINITY_DN49694_c0_g1_i1.p1  ORF type:complete len:147 (+),score=32.07 TRINITY_DN49694_c0_g1_i1:39-443(+)
MTDAPPPAEDKVALEEARLMRAMNNTGPKKTYFSKPKPAPTAEAGSEIAPPKLDESDFFAGSSGAATTYPEYPLETLQQYAVNPEPTGLTLDRALLEEYLNEKEFFKRFKMAKFAFRKLPEWKKKNLKTAVGIY